MRGQPGGDGVDGDVLEAGVLLLEEHMDTWLLNAAHIKAVPGRKSDVRDAEWIARLVEHVLVVASFVPPPAIRRLRNLTRYRVQLMGDRVREVTRVEKLLEDASIKLSAVVSNTAGTSAREMLGALVAGERDPAVMADLAYSKLRRKTPELIESLTGHFDDHHALLIGFMLDRLAQVEASLAASLVLSPSALFPRAGEDAIASPRLVRTTRAMTSALSRTVSSTGTSALDTGSLGRSERTAGCNDPGCAQEDLGAVRGEVDRGPRVVVQVVQVRFEVEVDRVVADVGDCDAALEVLAVDRAVGGADSTVPAAELARVVREVREDPYLASYPDVRVDSRVHTAVCAKDDPGHAEALERRYHPMLLAAEMCLNAR